MLRRDFLPFLIDIYLYRRVGGGATSDEHSINGYFFHPFCRLSLSSGVKHEGTALSLLSRLRVPKMGLNRGGLQRLPIEALEVRVKFCNLWCLFRECVVYLRSL